MKFAVSSLAFIGHSPEQIIALVKEHHWALEFSSGMPYRIDMSAFFLSADIQKYAHNYFPAPEIPFVLNLASSSPEIRKKSIQHCIQGLNLSHQAGSPFFSAHAGFCIDPLPQELGKPLRVEEVFDRKHHWNLFLESLNVILQHANKLGLKFLVENNVLAKMNVPSHGVNPLLCVEHHEMLQLVDYFSSDDLGLLIDTAHLKVSYHTLNRPVQEAVSALKPYIFCIHHSDNDGLLDTNQSIPLDYWFSSWMPLFKDVLHVLEVKSLSVQEISTQMNFLVNCSRS